ncbi:uncharacterized protein LOC123528954 [Mercenaria mercenaria]|uniref:uncharacterized protein LOC123528954 n=1 Tax=Mercenaria mercenaria TaxID=6596 RepID=UPI00234E5389|nr:uncharacterized protein LOC123528954 [Mercenaria mercenaria]
MERILVTTIFILCFTLCLSFTVPPGVEVRCPSRYRVQAVSDKAVQFEVVDNKTECDRLTRARQRKGIKDTDVEPSITLVYKDGHYRANISWEFYLRGKRLPRVFLINLTFYDIKDNQHPKYMNDSCVLLRLIGNRKVKTKHQVQFYFDCLPLLKEPDIGLVVQLWSYSRQDRPCRSLRSLPQGKSNCGPNVQCSQKYSYPISENAHTYIQCACYRKNHGVPKLHWKYDYTDEVFYINFTNVPPYLNHAVIDIVDGHTEDNLGIIEVRKSNMRDGEIHEKSEKFGLGNYTVYVCVKLKLYLECSEAGSTESLYSGEIDDNCCVRGSSCDGSDYYIYSDQKLNVSRSKSEKITTVKQDIWDEEKLETILGIVGGIILTVIVTTVTFFICRKRKLPESRSCRPPTNEIEMSELSPERVPLRDEPLRDENQTPFIMTNNIRIETTLSQTQGLEQSANHPVPVLTESCQRTENNQTRTTFKKYQVVLLYHPDADNPRHIQRIADFAQTLTDKYGIIIERSTTENWVDFAETAFDRFRNIVLIISSGLYRMLRHYLHSEQIPEELLSARNREITPCIVLNKMQTQIQDHSEVQHCSKQKGICLHIVNLDNRGDNDRVLEHFLNDHPFFKEHSHLYEFYRTDLYSEDLTPLIENLKPSVQKEMPQELQRKLMQINAESASLTDTVFSP